MSEYLEMKGTLDETILKYSTLKEEMEEKYKADMQKLREELDKSREEK